MFAVYFILALITLTRGEVPQCSEIVRDEVLHRASVNPGTDIYDMVEMSARISIPVIDATENWNVVMKLSRTIDTLTSVIANVTGDNTTLFNLHSLENNGKMEKNSVLSLPFVIKYTGGSPELEILSVDINDKNICNKPSEE